MSDDLPYALRQILQYSIAYIFCRVHSRELPFAGRPLMDAHCIALEVVAPRKFYVDYNEKDRFARVSKSLDDFARSQIGGQFAMSLNALAFPAEFKQEFEQAFKYGKDVEEKCSMQELSDEGLWVRDAFDRLGPAWPESGK